MAEDSSNRSDSRVHRRFPSEAGIAYLEMTCHNDEELLDWVRKLKQNPDTDIARCPWGCFGDEIWRDLVRSGFVDSFNWKKLEPAAWGQVLCSYPQLVEKCPLNDLKTLPGRSWLCLLQEQPQFAALCPWDIFDGFEWAELIAIMPQFAYKCAWEKLDGKDWIYLLESEGFLFSHKCAWEKLDGEDWVNLLKKEELFFSDKCAWEKLDGKDWSSLLREKPHYAGICSWEKLNGENWSRLLEKHPLFFYLCPWEKLNGKEWGELLQTQSQLVKYVPWGNLPLQDLRELAALAPELFFANCPTEIANTVKTETARPLP